VELARLGQRSWKFVAEATARENLLAKEAGELRFGGGPALEKLLPASEGEVKEAMGE